MRFPYAHKGMKKYFIGELLAILAGVLVAVAAILVVKPSDVLVATAGYMTIASGVLLVVGFVIQMVGLWQGGNDEGHFRTAFWIIIFSIVITITSTILSSVAKNWDKLSLTTSLLDIFTSVSQIFVFILVLGGIMNLASSLGREDMERRGRFIMWVIVILFVVGIVLTVIPTFLGNGEGVQKAIAIISVISSFVTLVTYVIYVLYLGAAVRMLRKK